MIDIRCHAEHVLKLRNMSPLQGGLKSRTARQVKELKASLLEEGLIAPFFIWRDQEGVCWIIDGHARHQALLELSHENSGLFIEEQGFPVVYIEAGSVEEAKKALLQVTSQYGKVSLEGARAFCEAIKGYRAPAVKSVYRKPYVRKAAAKAPAPLHRASLSPNEGEVVMTIAVPRAYEKAVRDLFMKASYIRVL